MPDFPKILSRGPVNLSRFSCATILAIASLAPADWLVSDYAVATPTVEATKLGYGAYGLILGGVSEIEATVPEPGSVHVEGTFRSSGSAYGWGVASLMHLLKPGLGAQDLSSASSITFEIKYSIQPRTGWKFWL